MEKKRDDEGVVLRTLPAPWEVLRISIVYALFVLKGRGREPRDAGATFTSQAGSGAFLELPYSWQ